MRPTLGVCLLLLIAVAEYHAVAMKIDASVPRSRFGHEQIRKRFRSNRQSGRDLPRIELLLSQLADPARASSIRMIAHELLAALGSKSELNTALSFALNTCAPPTQPVSADTKRLIGLFDAVLASQAFITASAKVSAESNAVVQNAKAYADGLLAHGRDSTDCDKFHGVIRDVLPAVSGSSASPAFLELLNSRVYVRWDPLTVTAVFGVVVTVGIFGCVACVNRGRGGGGGVPPGPVLPPVLAAPAPAHVPAPVATNVAVEVVAPHATTIGRNGAAACQIMYDPLVAATPLNIAMFAGFQRCAALATHLDIEIDTLAAIFNAATWIDRIESRPNAGGGAGATNPTGYGHNTPPPGVGRHFRVVLTQLTRITGQLRRHGGQLEPVAAKPCMYAPAAGAGLRYTDGTVHQCGKDLMDSLVRGGQITDLNAPALEISFPFFANANNVHGGPGANSVLANDANLLIRKPVQVRLRENIRRVVIAGGLAGAGTVVHQLDGRVWVSAGEASAWAPAFAVALGGAKNRLNLKRQPLFAAAAAGSLQQIRLSQFGPIRAGDPHDGTGNCVLRHNGNGVAWNTATANTDQPFDLECFNDNIVIDLTPANLQSGAGANNAKLNSQFPYYFNDVSAGFNGGARALQLADAQHHTEAVINNRSPDAFMIALQPHAANSLARRLKRELETDHGRVTNHWGVVYFKVSLRIYKEAKPPLIPAGGAGNWNRPNTESYLYRRHVGWICAATNVDVRHHTERICLEQLRHFVNALEAVVTHDGVVARVVEFHSRWILDFFPDATPNESHCTWAIGVVEDIALEGCFRTLAYGDSARNWVRAAGGANPGLGHAVTRAESQAWVQTQRGGGLCPVAIVLRDVIEWNAPHVTYTYTDTPARTQIRNRRASHALAVATNTIAEIRRLHGAPIGAHALDAYRDALQAAYADNHDPPAIAAPAAAIGGGHAAAALAHADNIPPNQQQEAAFEAAGPGQIWGDPTALHGPIV